MKFTILYFVVVLASAFPSFAENQTELLPASNDTMPKNGFSVVGMKADWKKVFSFDK